MTRKIILILIHFYTIILLTSCANRYNQKTSPTPLTENEIKNLITGKWYEQRITYKSSRKLQPAILNLKSNGQVESSFSYLISGNEHRRSLNLFWRIEDQNIIYSDQPMGEASMTGGVITKISNNHFHVYTTKASFSHYYRKPKTIITQ